MSILFPRTRRGSAAILLLVTFALTAWARNTNIKAGLPSVDNLSLSQLDAELQVRRALLLPRVCVFAFTFPGILFHRWSIKNEKKK